MIPAPVVTDASALVEFLLRTPRGVAYAPLLTHDEGDLHVPAVCDVEVASALRGLERRGELDARRSGDALTDFLDLPLVRHGHVGLLPRIHGLRHNFSAYDAAYVALAESLAAPLLSGDDRVMSAVRDWTEVELLEVGDGAHGG